MGSRRRSAAVDSGQIYGQTEGPPRQGCRTFLRNIAPDIAAMDLFSVPTIGFNLLYAFVIASRRITTKIRVDAKPEEACYFKQREDTGGIKVTSCRRHR